MDTDLFQCWVCGELMQILAWTSQSACQMLSGSNAGYCYRSVVCLSVRLSHSCTLLPQLDGMIDHSAGTTCMTAIQD